MNKASRLAAAINPQSSPFQIRVSLFHCTPVSERRRRNHWDSEIPFRSPPKKFNQYHKRLKKQSLLRNVSEFAEHLFQSWQSDRDEYSEPRGRGSSWSRPTFSDDEYIRGKPKNKSSRASRRFEFCEDDDDEFETMFRSGFGGNRDYHWSFTIDYEPRFRNSSSYYTNYSRTSSNGSKYSFNDESEYDYSSSDHYHKPTTGIKKSDRLALGLSASGPLNVTDVKNAYRACALKWHPDRHQGSSKVAAEEKFKVCSAAYQSICDNLAMH
ncbi:hypothetical protein ABFS82_10G171600 [Erythranthe guttata]|uniref:J domain-containing protein n=1 Tax=Erythranthe guttata TaxID=4155 RepID=A0A022RJ02_ERYGU|nr:PREDICTED: uncharacterized protein LOC105955231 isoform X1 [Erythranthe guttata]EYU39939.1 hypothetical protein MIMGU_mgv1a011884mg [Erythranthe guttata]|eukprot:XP_012834393.1 PREDICTED: uncharacterized protein LOC105955231 isoform X1 [Erythranthe guttata]